MLDLHTHILPNIDDGSSDIETSIKMMEILKADGVTDVVFTPHFYWHQTSVEKALLRRNAAYESIKGDIPQGLKVHLGMEVQFTQLPINYSALDGMRIEDGKYVLLELPYTKEFSNVLFKNLEEFIYQTGAYPIIAHTERYEAVARHPEIVALLIDLGCKIQVNCSSIEVVKNFSLVDAMLRRGQVHFLGTDAHNLDTRPPHYAAAVRKIESEYSKELVERIESNSKNLLENKPFNAIRTQPIRKWLGKYK